MMLKDLFGTYIVGGDYPPPVVSVSYESSGIPPPGYDANLVPPGLSDDGNEFRFDPSGLWIINLATKQFKAAGEYEVTVKAGDASYTVDSICSQTFTRQ